jgi:hypothetical protein
MFLKRALSALTTKRLMSLVLLLGLLAMASRPILDPDFWWHLRTGQLIWDTGTIPRVDAFSYTVSGQPWITHEWLTEVLIYALYAVSGQGGLILAFALIITAAFSLLYLQCEGRPYLASFVVVWAAICSAVTWGVRPQMLSLLFSAAFLYILYLYRAGSRSIIWLLPPLMALWVNLHGSFFLGLVYPSVFMLGAAIDTIWRPRREGTMSWRDVKRLALVTLITAFATILNPNGLQLLIYPFGTLGSPAMQMYIMEWFSPDFHLTEFQPFAFYLLALILSMGLSSRVPRATEFLLLIGFGYAALLSARHIPFFVLVTAPTLTKQFLRIWDQGGWADRFAPRRPRRGRAYIALNWLLLAVVALGVAVKTAHTIGGNDQAQREAFPVSAAQFIVDSELSGNMYNLYQWGGYLIWRLYPEHKVFIDGRADVYGDAFIEEYLKVYQLREGWREPLQRYDVRFVLIDRASALSTVLHDSPDWSRPYTDEKAAVFVRQDEAGP